MRVELIIVQGARSIVILHSITNRRCGVLCVVPTKLYVLTCISIQKYIEYNSVEFFKRTFLYGDYGWEVLILAQLRF